MGVKEQYLQTSKLLVGKWLFGTNICDANRPNSQWLVTVFNTVCFIAGCLELSVHGGHSATECKEVTLNNIFIVR